MNPFFLLDILLLSLGDHGVGQFVRGRGLRELQAAVYHLALVPPCTLGKTSMLAACRPHCCSPTLFSFHAGRAAQVAAAAAAAMVEAVAPLWIPWLLMHPFLKGKCNMHTAQCVGTFRSVLLLGWAR